MSIFETPQQSKYTPVWNKLKAEGKATLVAPATAHARIVKGIKHRRDKDVAFLFRIQNVGQRHKILWSTSGNVLQVELIYILTPRGI